MSATAGRSDQAHPSTADRTWMFDPLRNIIAQLSLSRSADELERGISSRHQQLSDAIASSTDDQLVKARRQLLPTIQNSGNHFALAHWQEVDGLIQEAEQKRARVSCPSN